MTRKMVKSAWMAAAAMALAGGLGFAGGAQAQSPDLAAALSSGAVGEQADGYMGVAGSVSPTVRKEVESINIKRRQVYTDLAGKRGVTVQDAAAALPAKLLGDVAGQRVLDMCAAPGGKTLQLAAAGAEVTALDLSETRLKRVQENLDRTGLAAGRNKKPFLLQTYRRDMGGGVFKMMKDLSAPIRVQGRHWGGLRLAYRF